MFMVGFPEEGLPSEVGDFIRKANIGFVVLFSRNVKTPSQVLALTSEVHSSAKIPPMIFTDQEGGAVCQFYEMVSTFTSAMGIAATADPLTAKVAGEGIAGDLKILGIDGVIAPVVDVNWNPDNPIIGIRSFSDEPDAVIKFAENFLKGAKGRGVAPVLKHYPGHGGTSLDSHLALPSVEESEEFFRAVDLKPFRSLAHQVDFIMSAHVVFPYVDPEGLPASFSGKIIGDILRKEVSFNGVVFTDCLEMAAIRENFSPRQMVKLAISAGADVLLVSHSLELQKELYQTLLNMLREGEIPVKRIDLSVARILRAKEKYGVFSEKRMDAEPLEVNLRKNMEEEYDICARSIVVLRDNLANIPIQRKESLGIIEWEKLPSTMGITEAKRKSYLQKRAEEYFEKARVLILPLVAPDFNGVREFLDSHDKIILAPYSRTPEAERLQGEVISEILKIREDALVVSLANPYDIRRFPHAKTYIAAFSFRDCTVKALFDVLTGRRAATGVLPVEIKGIFPRWFRA